jgi:hypothetical protein
MFPDATEHERQLSGTLMQVAQLGLQGTQSPLTETCLLSLEQAPEQTPVFTFNRRFFAHEVQKSTLS